MGNIFIVLIVGRKSDFGWHNFLLLQNQTKMIKNIRQIINVNCANKFGICKIKCSNQFHSCGNDSSMEKEKYICKNCNNIVCGLCITRNCEKCVMCLCVRNRKYCSICRNDIIILMCHNCGKKLAHCGYLCKKYNMIGVKFHKNNIYCADCNTSLKKVMANNMIFLLL